MVLPDHEIKKRLISVEEAGLPPNFLDLLQRREVPKELELVLKDGRIVMDPLPPANHFDSDSVDLRFGEVVEIPETQLELVRINEKPWIRRFTLDERAKDKRRLDHVRKVDVVDQIRLRFILNPDETLELQPDMLILAHTLEVVCVPINMRMKMSGRSWFARAGVSAELSSDVFHAGWCGHPVMEVKNTGKLAMALYYGLPFAAVSFEMLSSPCEVPYYAKTSARFSGQR